MKIKKLLGIGPSPKRRRAAVSDKELRAGLTVRSRYVLRELLGNGAFGEVWLAMDKLTEMRVALKFFLSVDSSSMDDFVKEFTLLGGISHPNILSAMHFDKWGTRPFVVMKYCPGGTASHLCGSISECELWRLIHDVASGLAFLQSRPVPIVHQDLKPSNILIDEAGNFMLSDFGISKKIESAILRMSTRALGVGTVPYMGPERFSGDPLPVLASDIWSLGASIYELATGELPFGIAGGAIQNNGGEIPKIGDNWSKELDSLMRACLSKETWDRPRPYDIVSIAQKHLSQVVDLDNNIIHNSFKGNMSKPIEADSLETRKIIKKTNTDSGVSLSEKTSDISSVGLDSCNYVDIGLSVKWADCFLGASDQYGLGTSFSADSMDLKDEIPCMNLPSAVHINELVEKCRWTPRRIGRSIVGFNVTGPNGSSIYIPFVEVQDAEQRVSKSRWKEMEKVVYFPVREETEKHGSPCKCRIDAYGAALTTSVIAKILHIRLVSD